MPAGAELAGQGAWIESAGTIVPRTPYRSGAYPPNVCPREPRTASRAGCTTPRNVQNAQHQRFYYGPHLNESRPNAVEPHPFAGCPGGKLRIRHAWP